MHWVLAVLVLLAVCFSFVLLYGAPYLPTLSASAEAALDLVDLKPGQTLLELGCGDGKVLIAAAQRGIKVVGYELNPVLALIAWLRTRRYKELVTVRWGNFWTKQWPPADGIFVFLLDRFMPKLDKKIMQSTGQSVKLVSFGFRIPDRDITAERRGVYLYIYHG